MSRTNSAEKIKLNSFEELFGMNEDMNNTNSVIEIPLEELYEFKNHPFKVREDDKMTEMVESIKEFGVIVPGIVRIRALGGYEIIAGHSRKRACELAGLTSMPMFVRNMSDDEAVIAMVDSNIQRETILPSEKAKAYRMKYDAIKHQGKVGDGLKTMSEESGESAKTVQRYVWLSRLTDDILDMLDEKKIGMGQATDLSFLKTAEQVKVAAAMKRLDTGISSEQTAELKKDSANENLSDEVIWSVLSPEIAPRKERRLVFKSKRLDEFFPESYTVEDIEKLIIELLKKWKLEQSG